MFLFTEGGFIIIIWVVSDDIMIKIIYPLPQELLSRRDEGYHKLQHTLDQAHLVLPNTSTPGKDTISEDLAKLRHAWDDLTARLTTGKTQLETATSQWELYEDSMDQLSKWVSETESAAKMEAMLQATLPEKRAQLERVKVSVCLDLM